MRIACCDLFCSLAVLDPRVGHTVEYFLHLSVPSVILTDSSTGSPVHVLMLVYAVKNLSLSIKLVVYCMTVCRYTSVFVTSYGVYHYKQVYPSIV